MMSNVRRAAGTSAAVSLRENQGIADCQPPNQPTPTPRSRTACPHATLQSDHSRTAQPAPAETARPLGTRGKSPKGDQGKALRAHWKPLTGRGEPPRGGESSSRQGGRRRGNTAAACAPLCIHCRVDRCGGQPTGFSQKCSARSSPLCRFTPLQSTVCFYHFATHEA